MGDFPLQCLIPGLYPGEKNLTGKCGKPMGKTAWNMIYNGDFSAGTEGPTDLQLWKITTTKFGI